ncbi:abietadienol/abietadienal oxidase [Iris pallida]|uniref:Abietadienol/abietadienal oxidase n=1 Tax=Iris pallida TaxID=29817 RepID=A0AAX6IAV3_IRIPA|nr:abietadienol/abietadienal oxidase [Iris pallida]
MEEIHFTTWTIVVVAILSSILFLPYLIRSRREKKNKISGLPPLKLPPGGGGWSSLIGDSVKWYNAISSSHPPSFVEEQIKRYGKIFTCSFFGRKAVVSADPAFNRYVMQGEGRLFQSSYPKSFCDLVGKNGVIIVQGEQQRKLHRISANMMRLDKVNSNFLAHIQMVMLHTFNSFKDNEVISLQDISRKMAINLMVNQLLGVSTESEINEMASLFSDFVDGCLSVPIDLPGFSYHAAMKSREAIIRKIKKIIESSRQQDELISSNGVLGKLLEEECLPDETVADFIINLLFAGSETTAKTMLFAVYFLTQCPDALEQLLVEQEKIRSTNSNSILSWDDYKYMPFTQNVIDETLRLGGIAIWLIREAKDNVEYSDFMIPKGFLVIPFLSAVHLDETIYPGALNFNPWRWMDEENMANRNWRSSPYFAPFGGGARHCPGAELARLQIALFLHHFTTKYRWNQVKDDRMSFFPSARLVNGFQIRIKKI